MEVQSFNKKRSDNVADIITILPQKEDKRLTAPEPSKISRIGLLILAVCFGGFVLWAFLAHIQGAVMAHGVVIVESKRKTIQHLEGGIVKKIFVKEGDIVKTDTPLIALDDEMLSATVELLTKQIDEENARIARLTAEKNDAQHITFPKDLLERSEKEQALREFITSEQRLFNARLDSYNSQREMLLSQIRQIEKEVAGLKEQLAAADNEIAAVNEQLKSHRALLDEGYVTRTVVLDLERLLAEKLRNKMAILSQITTNEERAVEYKTRLNALRDQRIEECTAKLRESESHLLELTERIRAPKDALSRLIIRAPIDGKVVDLKVATIGGVIAGKEPLMDIVPLEDRLIIEAKVSVDSINEVSPGQKAEITFSAFKPSTHPPIDGAVSYVSADRLTEKTAYGEMPYYKVYIEVNSETLSKVKDIKLMPGMNAQVAIATRERRVIDYLLSPLRDRLRNTFRES
ncbi:MAG: HlyD family type I secretion periplasmic adaptor subunit [Deltaproteobacteria bacterium]